MKVIPFGPLYVSAPHLLKLQVSVAFPEPVLRIFRIAKEHVCAFRLSALGSCLIARSL